MVITFLKEQNKKRYVVIGVVIVLGLVLVAFISGVFEGVPSELLESIVPPRAVQIDFEILNHPIFRELGKPRAKVEIPERVGRGNPFEPEASAPPRSEEPEAPAELEPLPEPEVSEGAAT